MIRSPLPLTIRGLCLCQGHFQAVPDPRWKIPPLEWGTVVHRVEQEEPLRQVAHDYGVSYEAVRRVLRAARRR